ncbi:Protein of unknown function [Pyronema omphalodes CBS 100304]|uniref:Uncharacterized protein n=1 Tax=Pyronema omphalodes (strain CBS 100304) TaxID=1076935 RepID=U4L759_PYROM|nr:Protein of unknown function [Pyronema omphalodes CBS 100304]
MSSSKQTHPRSLMGNTSPGCDGVHRLMRLTRRRGNFMKSQPCRSSIFLLGWKKKRCRFHFISDAGDASSEGLPSAYSVWSLEAGFDTPVKKSTATNRPKRDEVIAIFDRVNATRSANQKFMHKFIYGPGWYFGAQKNDTSTFPCPSGGELSYEVALVAKTHKLSLWNVGGNEGLGIEIIGLKSNW